MPEIGTTVEFDVKCDACRGDLQTSVREGRTGNWESQWVVQVEPCEHCMGEARDETEAKVREELEEDDAAESALTG